MIISVTMIKSQMTIYLSIGLVILLVVSSLFFLIVSDTNSIADLNSVKVSELNFDRAISSCLEVSALKGIQDVGYLNYNQLLFNVRQDAYDCVLSLPTRDIQNLVVKDFGYDEYNESLVFALDYSLITSDGQSYDDEAYYVFPRKKSVDVISGASFLSSSDNATVLSLSPTVTASEPILSVVIDDASNITLDTGDDILGNYVYRFGPSGTTFDEPVELRIYFDPAELEALMRSRSSDGEVDDIYEQLTLVHIEGDSIVEYYDTEINLEENYAQAYIQHFSGQGLVVSGCKPCSSCYFSFKSYEGTWRVRLPTGTSKQGSISVGGNTFGYRNQDKDCGCSRPSYTGRYSSATFRNGQFYTVSSGGSTFNLKAGGWQSCGGSSTSSSSSSSTSSSSGSSSSSSSGSFASSSGSSSVISSGDMCGQPGRSKNWDYSKNQACPTGRWNCDCKNHCASRVQC